MTHEVGSGSPTLVVRSEFAIVEVTVVESGAGAQLRLTDVAAGATAMFDALQLEGLCALGPEDRQRLASPEWRMRDEGSSAPILTRPHRHPHGAANDARKETDQ